MSAYNLQKILNLWERDDLTVEQAIGQTLLHIQSLTKRVGEVEKRVEQIQKGASHDNTQQTSRSA